MPTSVHALLREEILSGKLKPGSKIVIQKLQDAYHVGQNPLREALSRLRTEDLVTLEEQKGFTVAPMSLEELADLTMLRELLETTALRASMACADPAWQGKVLAANHELRSVPVRSALDPHEVSDEWERKHADFHRTLISGCGSPWLIRVCMMIFDHSSRYRRLLLRHDRSAPVALNVYRSHDAIVDAVVAGDVELAVQHLNENFVRTDDLAPNGLPFGATE